MTYHRGDRRLKTIKHPRWTIRQRIKERNRNKNKSTQFLVQLEWAKKAWIWIQALETKAEPRMKSCNDARSTSVYTTRFNHLGRLFAGKLRNGFSLSSSVSLHKLMVVQGFKNHFIHTKHIRMEDSKFCQVDHAYFLRSWPSPRLSRKVEDLPPSASILLCILGKKKFLKTIYQVSDRIIKTQNKFLRFK